MPLVNMCSDDQTTGLGRSNAVLASQAVAITVLQRQTTVQAGQAAAWY